MKGFLINKARHKNGRAVVYSLRISDRLNKEVFKVGFSTDFQTRLAYYPDRLKIDVLKVMMLPKEEAKKFEAFIHTNNPEKYLWIGKSFSGSKRECYSEELSLTDWYHWFKNGLPNLNVKTEDITKYLEF